MTSNWQSAVRCWWRRRTAAAGDDGFTAVFWAIVGLSFMMLLALLVDGSGVLRAKGHADDLAAQAARVAGQQIDAGQAIPGDAVVVDPDTAQQAAEQFLAQAGAHGTVTVSGDGQQITVQVTARYDFLLLSAVGYDGAMVSGRSTAQLIHQVGG
ncbi:hypothetical protein P8605_14150 [Streptomyces sp. T-3]|nr:hypothetical protein [Streptomyces sp. T-3]